jgi:hypothetical protein
MKLKYLLRGNCYFIVIFLYFWNETVENLEIFLERYFETHNGILD